MTDTLAKRAAEFICELDPFGDRFSAHDLERIENMTDTLNDQVAVATATYDAYYAAKRPPEEDAREIVDTILKYRTCRDELVKFVAMRLYTLRLRAQDEVREQSAVNINRANSRAPL